MKRTDLAYIAGLMDGEGSISIIRRKDGGMRAEISLTLTNEFLPNWLRFAFGGSVTHYRQRRKGWAESWAWRCYGETASAFLKAVYPYSILKKAEADIVFRFLNIKPKGKQATPIERFLREIEMKSISTLHKKGQRKNVQGLPPAREG